MPHNTARNGVNPILTPSLSPQHRVMLEECGIVKSGIVKRGVLRCCLLEESVKKRKSP